MRPRTVKRALALLAVVVVAVAVVLPAVERVVRDITLPLAYTSVIRAQAADKHLNPALIAAVIFAESKFEPRTSSTGAIGLMQIEPATAEFLARRSGGVDFTIADLSNPAVNIAYGAYYLRYLLDRYHHSETLALAAYNGGETNVDSWLAEAHAAGARFTVDSIPFTETRAYVQKVESAQARYHAEYGL